MATDTEIAWCAGFFDGEGHVSYHRGYPHMITGRVAAQLYANVPQASDNIEVLIEFQRIVGCGKLLGPYKMGSKGKTQHKIHFGVKEVEKLFLILKPYLKSEKTLDFQRALMGHWTHDPSPSAEDYARLRKMQEKKRRKEIT